MRILKITLAMFLAVTLIFGLCACGSTTPSLDKEDAKVVDSENGNVNNTEFKETTIEFKGCKIVVLGAEKTTDVSSKSAFRVWFDITNTSKSTNTVNGLYDISAHQGTKLEDAIGTDYVQEAENCYLSIRPGVTVRAAEEFTFDENGGMIEVTFIYEYGEAEPVSIELDPSNLLGAPNDEFIIQPIEDPQWTNELKTEGLIERDNNKYFVKIDSCDFTKYDDSYKLIRVYLTLKNISTESQEFNNEDWYLDVFQDGIQIKYPDDVIGENIHNTRLIKPDESISLAYCYKLISDSPVEVELTDYDFDNTIGTVFEVE